MVAPVDAFEMPEQQYQFLQMQRGEFVIRALQRMGHGMRQGLLGQIFLNIENIVLQSLNLAVLRLRQAPDEEVDLAFVIGETHRDFLAEDHAGQMGDLQTAFEGVVIRERHVLHPRLSQPVVGFQRVAVAGGKSSLRRTQSAARVL